MGGSPLLKHCVLAVFKWEPLPLRPLVAFLSNHLHIYTDPDKYKGKMQEQETALLWKLNGNRTDSYVFFFNVFRMYKLEK